MNDADWQNLLTGEYLDAAIILIEEKGFHHRLVRINGKSLICTRDYRTDRVNLTVENNKVLSCYLG
jgi:hypothetical protein